jgi:hypothetical protein
MRKALRILAVALSLTLVISVAQAAVKTGSACSKLGSTSTVSGKKYTCIKSGKKLVWNKGVVVAAPKPSSSPSATPTIKPSPTPTPTASSAGNGQVQKLIDPTKSVESSTCSPTNDAEDKVGYSKDFANLVLLHCLNEGRWFDYGKLYQVTVNQITGKVETGIQYANFELHYENTIESSVVPKTADLIVKSTASIENCKLSQIDVQGLHKGFNWSEWVNYKAFGPGMVIQLLPIQANDSTSNGDPSVDYSSFIEEVKQFVFNLSDGKWTPQFNTPHSYLSLPRSLESYKVGVDDYVADDATPGQESLVRASLNLISVDEVNAASMFMIVAPPTTSSKLFVRFSNTFKFSFGTKSHIKAFSIIKSDPARGTVHHDFFHLGLAVPDHYGDESSNGKDSTQLIGATGEILGTDRWGNMSGTKMDWLGWDKWIGGFLQDSQVICANVSKATNFWIKPSAVFGVSNKLLIIPTGKYTAIAVESMRNVGYNNLMPKSLMGLVVYSIDLSKTAYGAGFNIIRPVERIKAASTFPLPGDDALRVGDFVVFDNYKISVIEAGDFGDVVKVEKTS